MVLYKVFWDDIRGIWGYPTCNMLFSEVPLMTFTGKWIHNVSYWYILLYSAYQTEKYIPVKYFICLTDILLSFIVPINSKSVFLEKSESLSALINII